MAPYQLAALLRVENPEWEFGPAYETLGIFGTYDDPSPSVELALTTRLEPMSPRRHEIPVCYEMGLDLERCTQVLGISTGNLILKHSGQDFTVYALGFQPGFPYIGYLPTSLSGIPRLPSPRPKVESGMVGIALDQTGIYPSDCPGGWNLIGKTPLVICDEAEGFFPISAGDKVRFIPISPNEFWGLEGERL